MIFAGEFRKALQDKYLRSILAPTNVGSIGFSPFQFLLSQCPHKHILFAESFFLNRNSTTTGNPCWGISGVLCFDFLTTQTFNAWDQVVSQASHLQCALSGLISKDELYAIHEQQSPLAAQQPPRNIPISGMFRMTLQRAGTWRIYRQMNDSQHMENYGNSLDQSRSHRFPHITSNSNFPN